MKFNNMSESIYGNSASWQKEILKKVEEEFSEQAVVVNEKFREEALELLNDSKKLPGRGIENIKKQLPRFTYIKEVLDTNGERYDMQIDLLNCTVQFIKI